jgi:hypothetical protein
MKQGYDNCFYATLLFACLFKVFPIFPFFQILAAFLYTTAEGSLVEATAVLAFA